MNPDILLYLLAAVLIVVGLAGTILPALPGVTLVYAGMVLAAWVGHFQHVGWATLLILGMLTALALIVDFVAGILGAKRLGASKRSLWGAAVGTILGMFFFPIGLFVGPFAGALIGELSAGGTLRKSTSIGFGAVLGFVFGTLAKIALCFAMIGIFVGAWFLD
ncbi:MAG: DUF456 domain-containing protein [Dokdonella sp.]